MSMQAAMLRMASIALPRPHRARWCEEASAVLMAVSGRRRWWYTLDTVFKVPVLARAYRQGRADGLPGRGISAVVGVALLGPFLAVLSAMTDVLPTGRWWDQVTNLLAMGGLFALVATRSFHSARLHGRVSRYAGAVLLTAFVGTGPAVAWPLAAALDLPVVALVGNVLPAVWLAVVCAMALRRRTGPWPLAVLGIIAAVALMGVLGSAPLTQVPGQNPLALLIGGLSLVVAAPTYLIWSAWAGVRLILGRRDLLQA